MVQLDPSTFSYAALRVDNMAKRTATVGASGQATPKTAIAKPGAKRKATGVRKRASANRAGANVHPGGRHPQTPAAPNSNHDLTIPAWADNRVELAECLDYFQQLNGTVFIEDGIVQGCLVCDEDSFQTAYIDGNTVIIRVGQPVSSDAPISARAQARSRRREAVIDTQMAAFAANRSTNTPLVLIMDSECQHCPREPKELPGRYCVMGYFRLAVMWDVPSLCSVDEDDIMLKFERTFDSPRQGVHVDPGLGWWLPDALPSADESDLPPRARCSSCGKQWPRIYRDSWLCLNADCQHFWCDQNLVCAVDHLPFDRNWVSRRQLELGDLDRLRPSYELTPLRTGPYFADGDASSGDSGGMRLRLLPRSILCTSCNKCLSRTNWRGYQCSNCSDRLYIVPPGRVDILMLVDRAFVSYPGHPPLNPACPPDYDKEGPLGTDYHRIERFVLHAGARVHLYSPTQDFNELDKGSDFIYNEILSNANVGYITLERTLLRPDLPHLGLLSSFFTQTFGQAYDFSDRPPYSNSDAKMNGYVMNSIQAAGDLLMQVCNDDLGPDHTANSLQVFGLLHGQSIPWHTDGDDEVGETVAMLWLGGNAELRVRLQRRYFDYWDHSEGIIRGAHNWQQVLEVDDHVQAGQLTHEQGDAQFLDIVNHAPDPNHPCEPEEIVLPLIHGSVVVFTGQEITKFYEREIKLIDSLGFAIFARNIDPQRHDQLKASYPVGRSAGLKFIGPHGYFTTVPQYTSDYGSIEDSDESRDSSGDAADDAAAGLPPAPALQMPPPPVPHHAVRRNPPRGTNNNLPPRAPSQRVRRPTAKATAAANNDPLSLPSSSSSSSDQPAPIRRGRNRPVGRRNNPVGPRRAPRPALAPPASRTNENWTNVERQRLRDAVAQGGHFWATAASRSGAFPNRTPKALREQYHRMNLEGSAGDRIVNGRGRNWRRGKTGDDAGDRGDEDDDDDDDEGDGDGDEDGDGGDGHGDDGGGDE